MSMIKIENLTFSYPTSYDNVFENVSFQVDTDWKLGFVGRNGRGKTTFLNLLLGKYEYSGKILSSVQFDYFPYPVSDKNRITEDILQEICPLAEEWELMRELSYLDLRADNIEAFSKERNDEYVGRAEEYKAAKSALLEGLGLEHLFDHSHELTPKEKEIWMLFDRVDVAELLARDAFAKGAYMLGAEDREIMLK